VLLEVKGSLHLFNDVEGLRDALAGECFILGLKPVLALAPTPLAALVTARSGISPVILGLPQLVGQLSALPLTAMRWPQETLTRLAHMGVRTIGQALRLPRAGFTRRFGVETLQSLDRLTGRYADLREHYRERERFCQRRDLGYEAESSESLLAALEPLLKELGQFLHTRQCGVLQLRCLLRHRHSEPSSCLLRLAAPAADIDRLRELLGERLRALVLPEPVRSCELRSGPLVRRVLSSGSLWQPGEHGGRGNAESPELIERLRARLGPEAVYGLQVLPGHRPENTWSAAEPGAASSRGAADVPWPAFQRPVWLLSAPQRLPERDGMPRRRGPLQLLCDPERIETGWWDGAQVERDYYVAVDARGVRLWIFRERSFQHRWFLHGVFG
jgi:protein ImuB